MCFCDGKYFKVTNITTGESKTYIRAASIAKRLSCSRDIVFHFLGHGGNIHRDGIQYKIEVNKHPECEEVRRNIIQKHGISSLNIPKRYRHLLPSNRQ